MSQGSSASTSTSGAIDRAYEGLRQFIANGDVPDDGRLREEMLATALDVSRTPVRDALRRLEAEGVVRLLPKRGAELIRYSTADLENLFIVRAQLEPYAVRLAVSRLTQDDLDHLSDLAAAMEALDLTSEVEALDRLNRQFHDVFLEATGNPALVSAIRLVVLPVVVRRTFDTYSVAERRRSLAHHNEILAAAKARDPEWAEAAMAVHVQAARNTVLRATGGENELGRSQEAEQAIHPRGAR